MKAYDNLRIFEKTEVKELKRELAKPREGCKSEVETLSKRIQELERDLERERDNTKLAEEIASRLECSIKALTKRVEKLEDV